MGAQCYCPNYTDCKWKYVINDDNSCTYTGTYTFDSNIQRKSELAFLDRTDAMRINGEPVYIDGTILKEIIWQDHEQAAVTEIVQVDQTTSGDWATIKELTIKGTENLANIVVLSIRDKETGEVIIDKAKTNVVKGQFVYKCTPEIEGPVEGRDYVLTITDETDNVTVYVFTIYRTDSRAPLLRKSEFTEWSKTKHLEIPITDYGSGLAQTSLDNQYSYQATKYENGKYYGLYTFAEENYGIDEHVIYLRDGLGNARREWIKVGRVDNTSPTIKKLFISKESDGTLIKIFGDDYSEQMKAQGSGVADYAITKSAVNDPTSWTKTDTLKVTEAGTYYLWVRDKVDNIGNLKQIEVTPDYDVIIPNDDENSSIPNDDKNNIIINGDKFMYVYYVFYIRDKSCRYSKASKISFSVHGEKNNEENMYMYFSTSKDSVWNESELDVATVDEDVLINKLSTDCNIISWPVDNTREIKRKNGIYVVRGNNISVLTPPSNISEFMGNSDMKNIYIHIICQSGKEYITKTSAVKRAVFEQH